MDRWDGTRTDWNIRNDSHRESMWDAFATVGRCGLGSGHAYSCENGHRYGLPFGCGDKWCMHCEGIRAGNRANRISDKLDRVKDEELRFGRAVFTVHPNHQAVCSSEQGSKDMQMRAVEVLCESLGVVRTRIGAWTTFHPTSTKYPWRLHPHVELMFAYADISPDGIQPLADLVSAEILKEKWAAIYPGTRNINLSYEDEPGFGLLRYQVRPMAEDVYHALAEDRLLLDRTQDMHGLKPVTIPAHAERALREPGGVTFWRSYHRVRWHGAFANNRFNPLMEALGKPSTSHLKPLRCCPGCESPLSLERDESGATIVNVDPFNEMEIDGVMFTLCKSNTHSEDC